MRKGFIIAVLIMVTSLIVWAAAVPTGFYAIKITPGANDTNAIEIEDVNASDVFVINASTGALSLGDDIDFTLGAAENLVIDASTTTHTDTSGAVDGSIKSATTGTSFMNVNVSNQGAAGGAVTVSGVEIALDDDSAHANSLTWGINCDSSDSTATGKDGCIYIGATADYGIYQLFGAGQQNVIDASTTAYTGTSGALDYSFQSATTGAELMNIFVNSSAAAATPIVGGVVMDLDDDSSVAGRVFGLSIDSSDATGSSSVEGIILGNALDIGLNAVMGAAAYNVIDASTTASTTTAGVIDASIKSATAGSEFLNVFVNSSASAATPTVAGVVLDLDDDSSVAGKVVGLNIGSTDSTGSSSVEGILLDNTLEIGINQIFGAAEYNVFDAATTPTTTTAGVIDASMISLTDGADFLNLLVSSTAAAATPTVNGLTLDLDDDSSVAGFLEGININASDYTGSSRIDGIILGSALDYGIYSSARYYQDVTLVETTGTTSYGIYNAYGSSSVVTGTNQNSYGLYSANTKSGADTSVDTTSTYGGRFLGKNTGSTDVGTRVNYGVYADAQGDANGTSTSYGVYATSSGADTNWAGYFNGNTYLGGAVSGITTLGAVGDISIYDANNNGNPVINMGSSAAEALSITSSYVAGGQLLDFVNIATTEASATADRGQIKFTIDGVQTAAIDDNGIEVGFGNAGMGTPVTGTIKLHNATNGNALTIQPGTTTAATTLTLPVDDGTASQYLQTDGNGVLSWVTSAPTRVLGSDRVLGLVNTGYALIEDGEDAADCVATANITSTADNAIYRWGTKSLKIVATGAVADGNGIDRATVADWSGIENVGVWFYSTATHAAGDWVLEITDSNPTVTEVNLPAYTVANVWYFMSIDISGVADANKNGITSIAIDCNAAGATVARTMYFDNLIVFDDSGQVALNGSPYETQTANGTVTVAFPVYENRTSNAVGILTEGTNFWINTTDNTVISISDISAAAGNVIDLMYYLK